MTKDLVKSISSECHIIKTGSEVYVLIACTKYLKKILDTIIKIQGQFKIELVQYIKYKRRVLLANGYHISLLGCLQQGTYMSTQTQNR